MPQDGVGWAKLAWGALITLLTFGIAFAQYQVSSKTIRPSLIIQMIPASAGMTARYGKLSHHYRVHNVGATLARGVTFSVRTRHLGKTIHEDRDHNIGDMVVKEESGYIVHVNDKDVQNLDLTANPLLEEVTVVYTGENILRFWCEPTFTYKATFKFHPQIELWVPHPEISPKEIEECR